MTKAIEKLDWHTIIAAKDNTPSDIIEALDEYFAPFAQPKFSEGGESKSMLCIECDKPLTGLMGFFLGGGFEWGIAHGEGHCLACRWPARAHHFIRDAAGKEVATVHNFILQYHPDFVEKRSAA